MAVPTTRELEKYRRLSALSASLRGNKAARSLPANNVSLKTLQSLNKLTALHIGRGRKRNASDFAFGVTHVRGS